MCVPIIGAALGAAASVAGGVMKAQQQQDYVDAVNKSRMEAFNIARIARQREDRRQHKFDKKGYKALNQTRKDIDAESQATDRAAATQQFIDQGAAGRGFGEEGYNLAGADPSAGNAATLAERAKTIADAAAKSRTSLSNLAALSSYGSVGSQVGRRLQQNADLMSVYNNMRQGSLGVYQQEANMQPGTVDPPDTFMADMLTGFGGMFNRA